MREKLYSQLIIHHGQTVNDTFCGFLFDVRNVVVKPRNEDGS
jgi:hypothetical protein